MCVSWRPHKFYCCVVRIMFYYINKLFVNVVLLLIIDCNRVLSCQDGREKSDKTNAVQSITEFVGEFFSLKLIISETVRDVYSTQSGSVATVDWSRVPVDFFCPADNLLRSLSTRRSVFRPRSRCRLNAVRSSLTAEYLPLL